MSCCEGGRESATALARQFTEGTDLKDEVRRSYANVARRVLERGRAQEAEEPGGCERGCGCGGGCGCGCGCGGGGGCGCGCGCGATTGRAADAAAGTGADAAAGTGADAGAGAAAGASAGAGAAAGACAGAGAGTRAEAGPATDPITRDLYGPGETGLVPERAVLASLGCGNPTALAELREGEVVLDLGSGGGIDVLLSARRVGPSGRVYGLDMTEEMLALARENQREAGVENAEFLKGDIEDVPLPDASVDVVISNCVINLAADKRSVLREAFRVLRPGGRFAVSDVVVRGTVPAELRRNMELWVGCVAGALEESEFRRLLEEVGFEDVEVEPTRVYRLEDARSFLEEGGVDVDGPAAQALDGRFAAAFVRGRKPPA